MASHDVGLQVTDGQRPTADVAPHFLPKGEFKYLVGYNLFVALTVTTLLICILGGSWVSPLIDALLCMSLAGACGATLCNLRGIFKHVDDNNGKFPDKFKVPFYIRPVTGALTGLVTFFVGHLMVSSLANVQAAGWETLTGRLPYTGVALLAGFATQEFMQRLKEVAKTVFAAHDESEEPADRPEPLAERPRHEPAREFRHSQGEHQMHDIRELIDLNNRIGVLESAGDAKGLADVLASKLAFRRVTGAVDERGTEGGSQADGFLDKVKPGDPRETAIESIHLYGDRAIVTCIVTMPLAPPDKRKKYHNLRLFIRENGAWKLLGWANEEIP